MKQDSCIDSNASRREFLQWLGFGSLGLTAALTGCSGCRRDSNRSGGSSRELRIYGTGTLNLDSWAQAQRDLNVKVVFKDNGNDAGPVVSQMVSGTAAEDFDLGGLQGGSEAELAQA